jgi:GMP synthase (glutamine-hydrolysing)
MEREKIVVLDFGSQYAHLIAKRFRMLGYYSEIALPSAPLSVFEGAKGIVMSGGPSSVYEKDIPEFNDAILSLPVPILGLCYGHQLMAKTYGGTVEKAAVGEFGIAWLDAVRNSDGQPVCPLFTGITFPTQVWMSHQDSVMIPGSGFEIAGQTKDCACAALQNSEKKRYSLQCHCEVKDTPEGNKIFENFAHLCGMEKNWNQNAVLEHILTTIVREAGTKNVLLFLSGGVDSTVAFALLNKALGQDRVLGLHIDNGFMRKNESAKVAALYHAFGFTNFIVENAETSFLAAVQGMTDPQKKRMAVGENFITVRNEVVARQHLDESQWMLAQGTLYPDIIESGGTKNSKTIKTHHNRVAGIQELIEQGLIIEPLKDLYKDEVRAIGKKLGLSDELVMRHPFPGPGLSINVLCSTGKTCSADTKELAKAQNELNAVQLSEPGEKYILPVRSVGVQGDFRTYRFPAAVSFAPEGNGFYRIPGSWDTLEELSRTITNSADFINRCVIRLWQNPSVAPEALTLQEGYCDKRRLDQTRDADDIVLSELHASGWYEKIFQHLTITIPYASSAQRCSFVLRPVCSEDVMTARFARLPHELLTAIVHKIAALPYVDAVFFDLTNKPPATFGWE